ncbi:MAG: polyhydroxyalkanoate synthesis repressor PhaR [Candidatus Berkiellales bacterium]
MDEPRLIKKYPNRRLYDTAISSYITLEDVKRLVLEQVAVKVIDAKSQEDITHSTLLQIIIEQEEKGPSLFTTENLQHMIRFYGGEMQKMLGPLFTQGMTNLTQQNFSRWQQLQQEWLQTWLSQTSPAKAQDPDGELKENPAPP